jgi:hypothetical protein
MTTGVTRAAVLVLFLVTAGCSNSQPTTASVKGVIKTKQGQACDKALIVFHPLEKSRVNDAKPVAIAESNGEFVVRTHTIDDGAAPGQYGVTVVWPGDSSGNQEFSLSGEGNGSGADRLGGRYGNPKDPKIKVTVPASGTPDLRIEVDG